MGACVVGGGGGEVVPVPQINLGLLYLLAAQVEYGTVLVTVTVRYFVAHITSSYFLVKNDTLESGTVGVLYS